MNKYILFFLLLFSSVQAECYLKGFGGANWFHAAPSHGLHITTDLGWCADIALGYRFKKCISLELEASHRANPLSHVRYKSYKLDLRGHARSSALLINAIREFHIKNLLVTPYLGIGAGAALNKDQVHLINRSYEGSGRGFAWQALTGFSYPLTKCIDIGFEYRYFMSRQTTQNQTVGLWFKLHQ